MEHPERNIRLDIAYDGTEYAGWQWQKNALSVQQVITEGIEKITGERVTLHGSGRTDAGVHARGQVANFLTRGSVPDDRFAVALNTVLPRDIVIMGSRKVPEEFDSRRDAVERHYRYTFDLGEFPDVFLRRYALHVRGKLDLDGMRSAAKVFEGRHDFSAFRSFQCEAEHAVRTVLESDFTTEGRFAYFDIRAHAFLRNQVRIMVGTLLAVGEGKMAAEDVRALLESGDRKGAGPTAAAKGLCLMEVKYPGEEAKERH
jgi:tRNA pseudouridine38-40 synthase